MSEEIAALEMHDAKTSAKLALAEKRLSELETALAKAQALILEQEAEIERLRAGQCHH